MINREQYMEQIVPFIDKPFVKVITGIRRSGKSVVLRLIRDELLRRGVREERIIYLNFESFQWIDLKEAKALYAYIRGQAGDAGKYYILLDEIQEVDGWEKVVNSLLVDLDTDIYDRLQLTYVIVRTGNLFNGTVCRFPCHDLVF